jgi:4-hydroxybenzoate polyprenyltransferase
MKKRYIVLISIEVFSIIVFKSLVRDIIIKELPFGVRWFLVGIVVIPFLFIMRMAYKDDDLKENTRKIAKFLFWQTLIPIGIIFIISLFIILMGGVI